MKTTQGNTKLYIGPATLGLNAVCAVWAPAVLILQLHIIHASEVAARCRQQP